jgi:hypothetical protein
MNILKSKEFLVSATVFLLVSIPITTYLVVSSEQASRDPQASTVCEKDCVSEEGSSNTTELRADLNKDGLVNGADLAIVLSAYGKTGENEADLNDDNVVNDSDTTLLKSKWTK